MPGRPRLIAFGVHPSDVAASLLRSLFVSLLLLKVPDSTITIYQTTACSSCARIIISSLIVVWHVHSPVPEYVAKFQAQPSDVQRRHENLSIRTSAL